MDKTVQTILPGRCSARPALGKLVALATALVLLMAFLAGCPSSDEEGDAEEILSQAVPAMKALQSFAFTYDVGRPQGTQPLQGTDIVRIEGTVTAEGNMEAAIDLQQSGIPLRINFVGVGDTHYVQNPLTQQWQSLPASSSPVGELDLSSGAIQILEKVKDPSYEGTEEVAGVESHRIKGTASGADVEGIARAVDEQKDFPVEIWVGVDDKLVRRITLSGAATGNEPEETVRTIELTRFDEPVQIEPPA